jgi:hypothetical protein
MSESNGQRGIVIGGGNLFTLTFIVFLVLKLTGVIGWSWWWVTVPLWGGIAILGALSILFFVLALFIGGIAALLDRK